MSSYEHDLARWASDARSDQGRPIEATISSLRRVRQELREATLANRHKKLKDLGRTFDEATVLFDPSMTVAILQGLKPITKIFEDALESYNVAVRKQRGALLRTNQVTQQELEILKHDAGRALDRLITWFEQLPSA